MNDAYLNLYAVRNNHPYEYPNQEADVSGRSYGVPFPAKDDETAKNAVLNSFKGLKVSFDPKNFDLCIVARFYPFAKKPISLSLGSPKVVCNCHDIFGDLYNEEVNDEV